MKNHWKYKLENISINWRNPYYAFFKLFTDFKTYFSVSQTWGMNIWLWGEGWGEGIVRGFGMGMYTLLYLKWITNKDLWYNTWNSAQYFVATWMGGEFVGEWTHVYLLAESLHCSPVTITTLLIGYTTIRKKKYKRKIILFWTLSTFTVANITLWSLILISWMFCPAILKQLIKIFTGIIITY